MIVPSDTKTQKQMLQGSTNVLMMGIKGKKLKAYVASLPLTGPSMVLCLAKC